MRVITEIVYYRRINRYWARTIRAYRATVENNSHRRKELVFVLSIKSDHFGNFRYTPKINRILQLILHFYIHIYFTENVYIGKYMYITLGYLYFIRNFWLIFYQYSISYGIHVCSAKHTHKSKCQ